MGDEDLAGPPCRGSRPHARGARPAARAARRGARARPGPPDRRRRAVRRHHRKLNRRSARHPLAFRAGRRRRYGPRPRRARARDPDRCGLRPDSFGRTRLWRARTRRLARPLLFAVQRPRVHALPARPSPLPRRSGCRAGRSRLPGSPRLMDPRLDPAPGRAVRLIARLARSLLPLPESRPEPQDIHSVLVVRTDDRVGNVLLTLPLVRALQRALPHARVDFLTAALLSRWAARRWTVGADRGPARLVYGGIAPPPPPGATDVSAKLLLAAPLGLRLSPSPLETALGRGPSPVSGRFVALNPGARKQDHRWPAGRFAALAKRLEQTHGVRTIVFWGPGEEPLAQEVVAEAHGSADLAPPTNLDQLAAAFCAPPLGVTKDTGPMHPAVACGAPGVAVFPDAQGLRWAHPGARFEAVVAPADDAPLVAAAGRLLDRGRAPAQPAHTLEEPR